MRKFIISSIISAAAGALWRNRGRIVASVKGVAS